MSECENARIWNGIRDFLMQLSWRVAYGKEPWTYFSSGRDGAAEPARQLDHWEQHYAAETDEFIRQFVRTKELPRRATNVVRFYAGQRIDWAVNFLRILLSASCGE